MSKTYYFYKIYKDEFCYIGSTTDLKNRRQSHKNNCNNQNRKGYNSKIYKTIRDNGGWCSFNFELIKQFDNLTRRESQVIERIYIDEFGNLNSNNSFRTTEDNKESKNQYYLNNQEKCKEKANQYYLNNQEKCKEKTNQYRLNNLNKIKEKNSKKITCECGCEIRLYGLPRHRKTKLHQDYLLITVS